MPGPLRVCRRNCWQSRTLEWNWLQGTVRQKVHSDSGCPRYGRAWRAQSGVQPPGPVGRTPSVVRRQGIDLPCRPVEEAGEISSIGLQKGSESRSQIHTNSYRVSYLRLFLLQQVGESGQADKIYLQIEPREASLSYGQE